MEVGTPRHRNTNPDESGSTIMTIGRQAIKIDHLEAENASLRARLLPPNRNHATAGSGNMLFSLAASGQDTSSTDMVSAAEHGALVRQHVKLRASHEMMKGQNELLHKKYKELKIAVRQWKKYAEQKHQGNDGRKRKTSPVSTPPSAENTEQSTDSPFSGTDVTPTASAAARETTTANADGHLGGLPEMSSSPPRFTGVPDRTASQQESEMQCQPKGVITSSQTTVDDSDAPGDVPLPGQAAPSSDSEPIFVSTLCLKRKIGLEGAPRSPVIRIKQEGSPRTSLKRAPRSMVSRVIWRGSSESSESSSLSDLTRDRATLWAAGVAMPLPELTAETPSSDDCLDNFGPPMLTPRRPKRVADLRLRATPEEVRHPAPQPQRSASFLLDGEVGALSEQSMLFGFENNDAWENDGHTGVDTGSLNSRASQRQHAEVLKPISGNVPGQHRAPNGRGEPRANTRRTGARDKISQDYKDSSQALHDDYQIEVTKLKNPVEVTKLKNLNSRHNTLLQTNAKLIKDLAEASAMDQRHRPSSAQLRTPVSVVKRTSPVKPTTGLGRTPVRAKSPLSGSPTSADGLTADRVFGHGKSPPPVRPEEEPLRIRPVSTLRLQDFKINPKYMGTDFAFADTIRGRDARQNLHACTRADCCGGALEKVIKMGGTAMSGRTDADALEAYIGPAWQVLMSAKRPEEAKQLLLQAHAFCFANEHGKHRQAFERRSTPPGYWRADFPTTQEQVIDSKTADDMQKKEVEDRHREALREGGRWIFRDE